MRKKLLFGLVALLLIATVLNPVSAASTGNKGQPSQSCQLIFDTNGPFPAPNGFNSGGFTLVAVNRYAGSGFMGHTLNPMAVAQYDVACFQQSMRLGV